MDDFKNSIDNNFNTKHTYLFIGHKVIYHDVTIKKIKDYLKKNFDKPKKDIKGYTVKLKFDKNHDETPLIVNVSQVTITPNLYMGNEEGDGSQTFVWNKEEIKKYGFKMDYIYKLIDSIKNKTVSLDANRVHISDVLGYN